MNMNLSLSRSIELLLKIVKRKKEPFQTIYNKNNSYERIFWIRSIIIGREI